MFGSFSPLARLSAYPLWMVSHLYWAPVMKPLGASGACEALWPQVLTPRFSAVSTTTLGPSTWQVITSQPAAIRAVAGFPSLPGSDQAPVKITGTTAFGLVFLAPSMNELTNPNAVVQVIFTGTTAFGL